MVVEKLQPLLEQYLSREQPVLVGVSGGADSLCLLDVLTILDYPVVVAHFNHCIRPEAGKEARAVERIANQKELSYVFGEAPTVDFAQNHHLTIEEAARILRYRFLFSKAEEFQAQAVAVAHNADDQVETVLMHLLRGTGLDGLSGMSVQALPNPWSETIPLVRPLLHTWRDEIDDYCATHKLTPIHDATNNDTAYFRNRLRHELIPELENYTPGFRGRLHQTADLLAADRQLLEVLTEKNWSEPNIKHGPGYVIFNLRTFNFQPLSLRRRLIRRAIYYLQPGARDVDYALIQRAIDFAEQPTTTRQADLGLGFRIAKEDGGLLIAAWKTDLPVWDYPQLNGSLSLRIPGEVTLKNGWVLQAAIPLDNEVAKTQGHRNQDPFQAWINLGEQQSFLAIRTRRPGDRFQPLGMGGNSMKISDFMINEKIPQRARAGWPLVFVEDEIAWVPGFRIGESFRLTSGTFRVVKLTLIQTDQKS